MEGTPPPAEPRKSPHAPIPAERAEGPSAPAWASGVDFEVPDAPALREPAGVAADSRRYFTVAVAVLAAFGALLGLLAL